MVVYDCLTYCYAVHLNTLFRDFFPPWGIFKRSNYGCFSNNLQSFCAEYINVYCFLLSFNLKTVAVRHVSQRAFCVSLASSLSPISYYANKQMLKLWFCFPKAQGCSGGHWRERWLTNLTLPQGVCPLSSLLPSDRL